jgi:hypothetical protein
MNTAITSGTASPAGPARSMSAQLGAGTTPQPRPSARSRAATLGVALATLLLAAPASAQRLSVTPQPGLWQVENQVSYNGVDLLAQMRAMQAEMLRQLPADQRAMAEQMLREQGEALGGSSRECLTAEQAREMADPRRLLERMNEPDEDGDLSCRYELVSVSGNTLQVRGQCEPQDGWNGRMQGTMTLHDARRWSSRFSGTGRLRGEAATMPGIPNATGPVEFVISSNGRWVTATCGDVAPR